MRIMSAGGDETVIPPVQALWSSAVDGSMGPPSVSNPRLSKGNGAMGHWGTGGEMKRKSRDGLNYSSYYSTRKS